MAACTRAILRYSSAIIAGFKFYKSFFRDSTDSTTIFFFISIFTIPQYIVELKF